MQVFTQYGCAEHDHQGARGQQAASANAQYDLSSGERQLFGLWSGRRHERLALGDDLLGLGVEEMAFAHVERHVEFLPDVRFLMRVDPRDEAVTT